MKQVWKILLFCFCLNFFIQAEAAFLDAFTIKDIKDFEQCTHMDPLPNINITHTEDYEAITICWRLMTSAYPHCSGLRFMNPIVCQRDWDGDMFNQMLYGPVSGMSEDGKQAGWLGVSFEETSEGKGHQITWRYILYDNPLKIFEW